ncbi:hypothetical protein [Lysobacter gummosus]|uniref:hypothetical protein n=1 Tax=Lysobacter gummosus TaxID=262324 RepID=UPI003641D1C6
MRVGGKIRKTHVGRPGSLAARERRKRLKGRHAFPRPRSPWNTAAVTNCRREPCRTATDVAVRL